MATLDELSGQHCRNSLSALRENQIFLKATHSEVSRCLTASNNITAAAAETFSDPILPF